MNTLQKSLSKTIQRASVEITDASGAVHVVPLPAARTVQIGQAADGTPVVAARNWSADEAKRFVQAHERWMLAGWLHRVPILRRWAPRRPMSAGCWLAGCTAFRSFDAGRLADP